MKRVLILGASSDIGLEIVKYFQRAGWFVDCHGNSWRPEVVEEIGKLPNTERFEADFSDIKEVEVAFAEDDRRNADTIINCVGLWESASFMDYSIEQMQRAYSVNVLAPFRIYRLCIPAMMNRCWGRIVNLGSIGVKFGGGAENFPYSLTKHSLELIPSEFKKWAVKSVFYNTVRVGVTDTRIHTQNPSKSMKDRVSLIPLGRMMRPEEIAESVYWLGSEMNKVITGQVISLSGGE
tara:strand:+ start:110 stop:817 length:708 start_codon:yes stop_codon:yes gene_type:complete